MSLYKTYETNIYLYTFDFRWQSWNFDPMRQGVLKPSLITYRLKSTKSLEHDVAEYNLSKTIGILNVQAVSLKRTGIT